MPRFAFLPLLVAGLNLLAGGLAPVAAWADLPLRPYAGSPAPAAAGVAIQGLTLGFDGRFRLGCWTPARIDLAHADPVGGQLTVVAPDGDGVPVRYTIDYESAAPSSASLLIRVGRVACPLRVEFKPRAGTPVAREFAAEELPRAILSTQQLVLTLGPKVGLEEAAAAARSNEADPKQTIAAAVGEGDELPTDPRGYEGLSAILLTTGATPFAERLRPQQIAALDAWVRGGGRLVLSAAAKGQLLFDDRGSLRAFRPGAYAGLARQRIMDGLENYVSATERLDEAARRSRLPEGLELSLWSDVDGRIDSQERASDGFRPVVIRHPHGLGIVVFLAADLDLPPLTAWKDRSRLVWKLTRAALGEQVIAEGAEHRLGQLAHVGYSDLAGQLDSALDQFEGVSLVGFFWVAGLVVVYLLVIGPLDYFLLRNTLRQMEYTWLTFPVAVIACCGLAWALASAAKGESVRVNQLAIVDVDAASEPGKLAYRGQLWAHVYSPAAVEVDLGLVAAADSTGANRTSALMWEGLPGDSFGGMQTPLASLGDERGYAVTEAQGAQGLSGVPIAAGGTKSLMGGWAFRDVEARGLGRLVDSPGGAPQGELVNPLPIALDDCRLIYERWVYNLGRLGPGERRRIDWQLTPGDFEYRLTRRRVVETKLEQQIAYDQAGLDVERIAEMLMFHEAAGGRGYTRLWHRHRAALDGTALVRSGRAVLLGRGTDPAAALQLNGRALAGDQVRHWTWYRVVLPVAPAEGVKL